jgi:hypothetical protein
MYKDRPAERFGGGCRFFTHKGAKVGRAVFRVEFDEDADEGMATVSQYLCDAQGNVIVDPEANAPLTVVARMWVRAIAPGRPEPVPSPKAVLAKVGGVIRRFEEDPVPDAAFEAVGGVVHREVKEFKG